MAGPAIELWGRPESVAALASAEPREFAPAVGTRWEALDAAAGVPLLLDTGDSVIDTAHAGRRTVLLGCGRDPEQRRERGGEEL
ncbi:hypothetical protein ACIPN8_27140 [Streptomyces sp. NPDC086082]|uniref:hypothetical protein n=1 Tax=Streptomyces sp. NPDC086082 TaxID=3365750 RepID=UPI0037F2C208